MRDNTKISSLSQRELFDIMKGECKYIFNSNKTAKSQFKWIHRTYPAGSRLH